LLGLIGPKNENKKISKINQQKLNEANFLKANFDFSKAMNILNSINIKDLMLSEYLLEIKADILSERS
jgi:hypothetical protein